MPRLLKFHCCEMTEWEHRRHRIGGFPRCRMEDSKLIERLLGFYPHVLLQRILETRSTVTALGGRFHVA